jgi:hypothetical protein
MAHHHSTVEHFGRAGWFAIGALAASVAFLFLFVASDHFTAVSGEPVAEAQLPALVIEGE